MLVNEEDTHLLGCRAWQLGSDGYAMRKRLVSSKPRKAITERAHRLIVGARPGEVVDHINRNPLDNRRENLRIVSRSTNLANSGPRIDNTSGYRGVFWHKGARKWMAQASLSKELRYLGLFANKEEAARAYDSALLDHYGPNTGVNFDGI